jgi:fluoroquinolone transport system permease protein
MIKYKLFHASLATAFIWIALFLLLSKEEAAKIAPLLIFVDVSLMSIILIGASHHFEKQEGTIKTMMIMPVSLTEILLAKFFSSLVLGIESAAITSAALYFIHGIKFNYPALFIAVVLSGVVHSAIAFLLALNSKEFTSTLGLLMAYVIPFQLPTMLFAFDIIDDKFDWLLMLSPSHTASSLISFAVRNEYDARKMIIGCIYLVILSAVLLRFFVFPRFKNNAVRG